MAGRTVRTCLNAYSEYRAGDLILIMRGVLWTLLAHEGHAGTAEYWTSVLGRDWQAVTAQLTPVCGRWERTGNLWEWHPAKTTGDTRRKQAQKRVAAYRARQKQKEQKHGVD